MPTIETPGLCLGGVAFVTGGARGLGLATACAFAREGARALVLVDLLDDKVMQKAEQEVQQLGAEVRQFPAESDNLNTSINRHS
jgi:NAD(P)-dependent dehydrogenase (short-subunit alcohol dehydrogenase family)